MKLNEHIFVPKNWGFEKIIVNNDQYCGKLLYFVKGKRASLHYHRSKNESFYVHSGSVKLYYLKNYNLEDFISESKIVPQEELYKQYLSFEILESGDSFDLNAWTVHQVFALEDSQVYEFSTHSEDSDSYRIIKGS